MTIPRYVVGTAAEATQILNRLSRIGWHPRPGFTLPSTGTGAARLVLYGRVPTLSAAQAASAAAGRGVGIVAIADPGTPPGRSLLSALEALGPVHRGGDGHLEPVTGAAALAPPVPPVGDVEVLAALLPEQRALLGRLANGETIATAAAAEYLSLRTANRRIAQARAQLGVRTTREAVLVFVHQRRPD